NYFLTMLNEFFLFNIHARRFIALCIIAIVITGVIGCFIHAFWFVYILVVPVTIIGIIDMNQSGNTIIRNFPVLGHFRYLSKSIAPELHQYFVESNTDGKPFDKIQRDFVNQRADK